MCLMTKGRNRGQAMVEFALTAGLTFLILFGIIDFAILYASRIAATNAVASAARYAATSPKNWSNNATPPANSIEGKLFSVAVLAYIPNDDSHIKITYLVAGTGAGTICGKYSVASGFVPQNGYTSTNCLVPGTIISVEADYVYTFAAPVMALAGQSRSGVNLSVAAAAVEEQ